MSHLDNERLKQIIFLLILAFLAIILFKELYAFLPGFLGAVTFYVLSRKYMFRLVENPQMAKELGRGYHHDPVFPHYPPALRAAGEYAHCQGRPTPSTILRS